MGFDYFGGSEKLRMSSINVEQLDPFEMPVFQGAFFSAIDDYINNKPPIGSCQDDPDKGNSWDGGKDIEPGDVSWFQAWDIPGTDRVILAVMYNALNYEVSSYFIVSRQDAESRYGIEWDTE
jgi:hypothetical protein